MQPERWNSSLDWIRLLTLPDRKAQVEEFLDLQSIVGEGTRSLLSQLYGYFSLLKGINPVVISKDRRTLYISEGLIYIEVDYKPYLINMKAKTLHIPASARYIGLKLSIYKQEIYYDPTIAAPIAGQQSSDRLKVKANYVFNDPDSYPIALLSPDLKVERIENSENFRLPNPSLLSHLLEQRREEESSDSYIYSGLHISLRPDNQTIKVDPGKALIKGRLINVSYPYLINLPPQEGTYQILLDNKGSVYLESLIYEEPRDYTPIVHSSGSSIVNEEGSILVSAVEDHYSVQVSKEGKYYLSLGEVRTQGPSIEIVDSLYRVLGRQQLEDLREEINAQTTFLTQLSSSISYSKPLSGIHTDSLQSLDLSDIYHPLFSCSLLNNKGVQAKQAYQHVSYSIKDSQAILLIEEQGAVRYLVPDFKVVPSIRQSSNNSYMAVPKGGFSYRLYPSYLYLDPTHKNYHTSNQSLVPLTNTECNLLLRGLSDNHTYKLFFNNLSIATLSNTDLVPRADSSLELLFNLPSVPPSSCYLLELRRDLQRVWSKELIVKSGKEGIINPLVMDSSIEATLYQPIDITESLALTSLEIGIKSIANISSIDPSYLIAGIAVAPIVGIDTLGEPLCYVDIKLQDFSPNRMTKVKLRYPINLKVGKYALLLSPYIQGLEVLTSDRPILSQGLRLKEGNAWTVYNNKNLTFSFNKAVPIATTSITTLDISSLESFSSLSYTLLTDTQDSSLLTLQTKEGEAWVTNTSSTTPSTKKELRLILNSSPLYIPVVDIGSSKWVGSKRNSTASWISLNREFHKVYSKAEICITYKSSAIEDYIKIYISSDKGLTWNAMREVRKDLYDNNESLYKSRWLVEDLSEYVEVKDPHGSSLPSFIKRTSSTIRVDLFNGSSEELYIKDLTLLVS